MAYEGLLLAYLGLTRTYIICPAHEAAKEYAKRKQRIPRTHQPVEREVDG